ncbi:transglutaminase [Aquimarina algiphila]|uniref:Transglutaminase n=1 Tax=Aquimarina algiphila TaxID=2047982 RepID=A0A554VNK0_9FLAO|nr:transglutaminase [Aquimarina algiphila]TSE09956.1 transglutaminase [Aquimarina algiphila]
MKNLEKLVLGFILMVSISSFAQEYKFGKVSKEELSEVSCSIDSTAHAAVLYENKDIHIDYNQSQGFQLVTEVFKRVKLYSKDGFDYATDEIFLYKKNSDNEKVVGLKGVTYNLVNDKIEESKLKKEGVFESEFSEYYDQVKFTMPSLQEGSVIEYKYKIISPFVSNIDRIYLQYEIPIKKIDVTLESPEYFYFKKFTTGYLPIDLKESNRPGKITLTSRTRTGGGWGGPQGSTTSVRDLNFKIIKNKVNSTNVAAFKVEPYSGNIKNYISSISYELSYMQFPNEPAENYSTTWEDVTKRIYANSSFGDELRKKGYYEEDLKKVISGSKDQTTKMIRVFEYVKNRMRWNNKYSVITNVGVKKAYKEQTGNVAEINLMLTSMLSSVGLNAKPVLVSASNKVTALFPTLDGFNYVVSRVKLADGRIAYLDATDRYGLPNVLPDRVIRGAGRVIAKNGTSQRINFRPTEPSTNRYMIQCQMDKEGMIDGKFNVRHMEYFAHDFRVANGAKDNESKIERFKKRFGIDEIEEYTVKGVKEYGKGVSESFNFKSYDQIELIDNEMYFSPLLFLRDKENVFKSDERAYPIDFGHGFTNTYMVNIKIPEGYEVAEMPKAGGFKMPENVGAFSFKSNVSNGTIQVIVNETVNTPFLNAEYYSVLKQFYNQLIEKENEQIVLKKI